MYTLQTLSSLLRPEARTRGVRAKESGAITWMRFSSHEYASSRDLACAKKNIIKVKGDNLDEVFEPRNHAYDTSRKLPCAKKNKGG
jgi:hypothetical protein